MADKKISELDPAAALTGAEQVPVVQTGDTVRTTITDLVALAGTGREIVTSARTYYINNDTGSDANDGLTALTPFETIQKAVNIICDDTYWLNIQPTISVAKTGIDYDEELLLRNFESSGAGSTAFISGDVSDATHQTGVLLKPTVPVLGAAVAVSGANARWLLAWISIDGSDVGNCVTAGASGFITILAGDLGGAASGVQLQANNRSHILWSIDGLNQSHIYGAGWGLPGDNTLAFALNGSSIIVNTDIVWDDDPSYGIIVWVEQNAYFEYYHNCAMSGVHPAGQRMFLRENSRMNSQLSLADMPGDSWTSENGSPIDRDCTFNSHGFTSKHTFATIPSYAFLEGTIITITDSNTQTPGAAVAAGGGAFTVPLWYTGSGWVVLAPVSSGGSPGGATTQVQYNLAGAFAGDDEFTYDSAAAVTLGKVAGATGAVKLKGLTSGTVTLSTLDAAGTWTMKLPNTAGTNTYLLQTDGSGNTSWVTPPTAGALTVGTTAIVSGVAGRVLYEAAGNVLGEAASFTIVSGEPQVAAGKSYMYDGSRALSSNGATNWFVGSSGNFTMTATRQTMMGFNCGVSKTSGDLNVIIGSYAAQSMTTGGQNVIIGDAAMFAATSGNSFNVVIGQGAASAATTGLTSCVAIGVNALGNGSGGTKNIAVGGGALINATSTSLQNVAVGESALAALTDGADNFGLGFGALDSMATGGRCIGIGSGAGGAFTSTSSSAGLTAIGYNAAANLTTGLTNTIIGYNTGLGITTGDYNTVIGAGVSGLAAGLASNVILATGAGVVVFQYDGTNIIALKDAVELTEMTAPAAPAANKGRLYMQDNGGGKTQLCVLFPSGAAQVIATEP